MSQGPDGKFNTVGYEVVPHTKSDAGLRDVYLPKEARDIIFKIRLHNQKLGIDNPEGWLFFNTKNEKMHERSLARKMEKLCALAAISPKSLHKLRKTYISKMLDSGVSDDKVRETVGHNSLKVTYSNYYFDSKSRDETEAEFESVWSKVV